MRDPTDLRGQDADSDEAAAKAELQRKQEIEDVRWLMSSPRGRRFVWRVLSKAGIYRTSFTGNSETFFREGARNLGLFLLAEINDHALDDYVVMLREAKET